jgi:DNA-binding CsgD family transcriptional regulator
MAVRSLTRAEEHVARLVAVGRSADEVALELGLSPEAVAVHLSRARRKLGARSTAELSALLRARSTTEEKT